MSAKIKAFYFFPQTGRIGEIAQRIPRIRNLVPEDRYDLTLLLPGPDLASSCNPAVLEMVCRGLEVVFVTNIEEAYQVYQAAKVADASVLWVNPDPVVTYKDFLREFQDKPRNYVCVLDEDDLEKGRQLRAKMGMPPNAKIVTMHVREAGYLAGLDYHDHRNADIQNYFYAMIHLVKQGYWVVRLGDSTMQRLKEISPQVIDAPFHPEYDSFFDLYFIASSRFYLGIPSGPSMVAEAFMVPQLMTNAIYAGSTSENEGDMFIYKKYYSHQLGRALTYEEIVSGPLADCHRKYLFEHAEISLIENTATEIFAAVWEMESRLHRRYPFMEEAESNMKRVREIQKKAHILRQHLITKEYFPDIPFFSSYLQKGVISNEFIRMNPGFLGQKYPDVTWGFHPENRDLPGLMEHFYRERVHHLGSR